MAEVNVPYAPVIRLIPKGGPYMPTLKLSPHRTARLTLAAIAVTVVLLTVLLAGAGAMMRIGDKDTDTTPRLGVVAVCMWPDAPNPEGFPICDQ